jgi:ankyrin repeat protein
MPWCRARVDESPPGSPTKQAVVFVRAAASGSVDRVKQLLHKMGKEVVHACKADGTSALHAAAEVGSCAVCAELLSAGAAVNLIDCFGSTALTHACRFGHDTVTVLLLNHDADPNRASHQGSTPLMRACAEDTDGHVACVRALLRTASLNIGMRRTYEEGTSEPIAVTLKPNRTGRVRRLDLHMRRRLLERRQPDACASATWQPRSSTRAATATCVLSLSCSRRVRNPLRLTCERRR